MHILRGELLNQENKNIFLYIIALVYISGYEAAKHCKNYKKYNNHLQLPKVLWWWHQLFYQICRLYTNRWLLPTLPSHSSCLRATTAGSQTMGNQQENNLIVARKKMEKSIHTPCHIWLMFHLLETYINIILINKNRTSASRARVPRVPYKN